VLFRKSNKAKPAKEKEPASAKKKAKAAKGGASAAALSSPLAVAAKSTPAARSYRKPEADLYTVMLVVSLLAVIIGIVFLCLEMNQYKWEIKGMAGVIGSPFGGLLSLF